NELLIHRINELREKHSSAGEKGKDDKPDKPAKGENEPEEEITENVPEENQLPPVADNNQESNENKGENENKQKEQEPENKGLMPADATVADQKIKYPNDIDLLNTCREKCEEIIDILYPESGLEKNPRTHRQKAGKLYPGIAKKKNRTAKVIRRAIKQQLNFVGRDIRIISSLPDRYEKMPLDNRYRQQREMYSEDKRSCDDRIVNIFQPYVRPVVRGKSGRRAESGSKVNISLIDGMVMVSKIYSVPQKPDKKPA
ncbi:MAG: hypothetical protein WCJ01_05510, partial [Ignavibacteria bacterium]